MKLASYSKVLVAVAGVITSALETTYATAHWLPAVTGAISAVLVYLVPNVSAPPAVSSRPAPPGP